MKKIFNFIISFLVLFALSYPAFALSNHQDQITFNLPSANKKFEAIKKRVARRKRLSTLTLAVQQLSSLQGAAEDCVDKSKEQLKRLDTLLKSIKIDTVVQLQRADQDYLQDKKLLYSKRFSECNFFVFRSQEVLTEYKDAIQELSSYEILKRSLPIWEIHKNGFLPSFKKFDIQQLYTDSGLDKVSIAQWIVGLLFVIKVNYGCKLISINH